ncbi:1353846e-dc6b-43b6-9319-69fe45749672 [Sclerotinia trifoliorum]|uniref:1353846e-dc6b-43b6-9319-69fe45749672 n=1 Tax=Sclerotinia trifoliorum TaxID=28548 RepID=A0A8H2ZVQ2_9HELO|nr:1353846e-dc6b-43b6-9319-69fe45749672 [Sclerotinia trifoliorum]
MLRNSRLPRRNVQSLICWNCLANLHTGATIGRRQLLQVSDKNGQLRSKQTPLRRDAKSFSTSYVRRAEIDTQNDQPHNSSDVLPTQKEEVVPIRERLRAWEAENASQYVPVTINDNASPGTVENSSSRIQDIKFEIDDEEDVVNDDIHNVGFDDLVDVGSRRGFLIPGDLVEVIGKGQRQELAIYIRDVDNLAEFYTMSGVLMKGSLKSTHFYVPGFIGNDELDIIRPFLPSLETEQLDTSNNNQLEPQISREVTKPILDQMLKFWAESEAIYQRTFSRLDHAHSLVAKDKSFRYATLDELANEVIPQSIPRTEDGKHSYPALYALHRSLLRDEIGFRPQLRGATRTGGQYEISSKIEVKNIIYVVEEVRKYQKAPATSLKVQKDSLLKWVKDCQGAVDESRKSRQLTIHGTIKTLPASEDNNKVPRKVAPSPYTEFIKSWAAFRTIDRNSTINAAGSAILRFIERYENFQLDQSTAWTFLQEIGEISPTANRVAFDLRVHNHGYNIVPQKDCFTSVDSMSALRKNFHLPVYCIDAANAHEVDDGVSIERTETPDEYWVHVHAADPASRLELKGEAADGISNRTETIYSPNEVHFLLPSDFVQDNLSLDTSRPSLTFSAKMNLNGDILETHISPRTILDVKFMTPQVVQEVITGGNSQSSKTRTITATVGLPISPASEKRNMLQSSQLSQEHKEDLRLLHKIGDARLKQRIAKGGVSMNSAQIDVSVSPTGETIQLQKEQIKPGSRIDAVAPLMLIAAEVAAQWCHDRGVPIPYRITPRNLSKRNPLDFYRKVVIPSLDEHGYPPVSIAIQYFQLLGSILPSTIPGPHVAVGVEMMAKCTSPLRRYGDLLLHWQVQATLREEARLGHDLRGNTKEDFLPFSKVELDRIITHLDARERMIKQGNRDSIRHWLCHFLVRAWRFKEAVLPPTFRFRVSQTRSDRTWGKLNFFDAYAELVGSETFDIGDVKAGDSFEVELEDVNVYLRSITVKAIRRFT